MKIIIADAKSLKVKHNQIIGQKPLFTTKSKPLFKVLTKLTPNEIHDLMKISFKQSSLIYDYYHNEELYPALNLYDGVVFKQLEIETYENDDYRYLEDHLLIMSPLYGILRYNDEINFHRLEMKHHLNKLNLYDYWSNEVNSYLKNEDMIISLSTGEYEKLIDHPNLIRIDFGIISGDKIKRNAVYLKQARGKMLNYLVKHHLTTIEQIKNIVIDGYCFNEQLSTNHNLVFLKPEIMTYKKL